MTHSPVPGAQAVLRLSGGGAWPLLRQDSLAGMALDDQRGLLGLQSLPGLARQVELTAPGPITGLAIAPDGDIFFAADNRVWRVDCAGAVSRLAGRAEPGAEPGQFAGTGGLVLGRAGTVVAVDAGNHRLQVIGREDGRLRAIVGQGDALGIPIAGKEAGRFDSPGAAAVDTSGAMYIVDRGNGRVQQFGPNLLIAPAFWELLGGAGTLDPVSVAAVPGAHGERLFIADMAAERLVVCDAAGALDETEMLRWAHLAMTVTALCGDESTLYLGAADGRVHVFAREGRANGVLGPFGPGPVTALAIDPGGGLVVACAGSASLHILEQHRAFPRRGNFLLGPIDAGSAACWQRVTVEVDREGGDTYFQLFSLSSDALDGQTAATAPSHPAAAAAGAASEPTPGKAVSLDRWRAAPAGATDFLALNAPGRYFWLAGIIEGDGLSTLSLREAAVTFDGESWLRQLPPAYQRGTDTDPFAERLLLLLQGEFGDLSAAIDDLPSLFNPAAAPDAGNPADWLDWLGGWVDATLVEGWTEATRRAVVAEAFRSHARRGTAEHLRALLERYAGGPVTISEPAARAALWALGEHSVLGADTMLAVAHAEGAVVGTTATLGQSHLIAEDEYGAPLFAETAHHFCVSTLAPGDPGTLALLREVIEREKPAHTTFDLCAIGADLRVGFQARIGIDAIVAGPPQPLVMGGPGLLGFGTALPGLPPGRPPAVGVSTRLSGAIPIT